MKSGIRRIGGALFAFVAALLASSAFRGDLSSLEGILSSGIPAMDSVATGNGWINNQGDQVDYWAFNAIVGDAVHDSRPSP